MTDAVTVSQSEVLSKMVIGSSASEMELHRSWLVKIMVVQPLEQRVLALL